MNLYILVNIIAQLSCICISKQPSEVKNIMKIIYLEKKARKKRTQPNRLGD